MKRFFLLAIMSALANSACSCAEEDDGAAQNDKTATPHAAETPKNATAEAEAEEGREEDGEERKPPTPLFLRKPEVKLLSPEEQKAVLERRTTSAMSGSFSEYADLLYGISDVFIAAEAAEILNTKLRPVFDEDYRPTFRELFEVIGRQTLSTWSYSAAHKAWLFAKPAPPPPLSMPLAAGWRIEDRGLAALYLSLIHI
ncbi:MAG: hypothetical protein N3A66_08590 [Planctomycetota bacterium]|nr:hypothetical protein [Planctomycetota bacterium]